MNINSAKQVGTIYYMVKDIVILESIARQEVIATSMKAEPRSKGGDKYYYVSFLRDVNRAGRNPNRWVYGVQIDGDRLSNRYSFQPYSYAGHAIETAFYRVKQLNAYDDGTYALSLVDWRSSIPTTKDVFDTIENLIISDAQNINDKYKLEFYQNKRSYRGKSAVKQYTYNVPKGGLILRSGLVPDSIISYLLKHTDMNETEERIWILDDKVKYIDISGCITGYIEPLNDYSVENAIDQGKLENKRILHYN